MDPASRPRRASAPRGSEARAKAQRDLGKRERLIAAASVLLHQQGVEKTTLAEIAEVANVPVGNVYYYFKTKNEIVAAVVEVRKGQVGEALSTIDHRHRSPRLRVRALLAALGDGSENVARFGCPNGSLCSELDKRPGSPDFALAELMSVPIDWAATQFRAMGRDDAQELAVALLAAYQGSALLANTFRDPMILTREMHRLGNWIDTL